MKKIFITLIVVSTIIITSCVTDHGNFTLVSTKNVDWAKAATFERKEVVTGVDKYHIIVFIPTKLSLSFPNAISNALSKVPGAVALIDVEVSALEWYIPYIYGQGSYRVTGTVLVDPALLASSEQEIPHDTYYVSTFDETTNGFVTNDVSEAEFNSIVQ